MDFEQMAGKLIELLRARLGPIPTEVVVAIRYCTDRAELHNWFLLALEVPTFDAFRAAAGI